MKAIVYLPKTQEGIKELERKTAQAHAKSVSYCLNRIAAPKEQKTKIIQNIIDSYNVSKPQNCGG